jgi:putative membrane protein
MPSLFSFELYPRVLLALLVALGVALGIAPHDRADWLLENSLLFAGVAVLVATRRRLPLSRVSYTLLFVFLCLHTVGAHYTYSLVPYREWLAGIGVHLDDGRNHFDRLVHLSYGLLLAYPVREVFVRVADARGFWGYYLPLDVVMATSMLYELIEWAAAETLGGELGVAYLGTQGDPWDAQKDMALAAIGAVVAMLATAAVNWRGQKDFAKSLAESLRVKHPEPLGEESLARRRSGGLTGNADGRDSDQAAWE